MAAIDIAFFRNNRSVSGAAQDRHDRLKEFAGSAAGRMRCLVAYAVTGRAAGLGRTV